MAGYEGVDLARSALAGDQSALDAFHRLAKLVIPVTEHGEGYPVRVTTWQVERDVPGRYRGAQVRRRDETRVVFQATNEGGYSSTVIDAAELVAWILSPDGRAALARRGVIVPEADRAATSAEESMSPDEYVPPAGGVMQEGVATPTDVFAGAVRLTAHQRAYVSHALTELYMTGEYRHHPPVKNRREFHRGVVRDLLGPLVLDQMVTPDGARLVSVAEHEWAEEVTDHSRGLRTELARRTADLAEMIDVFRTSLCSEHLPDPDAFERVAELLRRNPEVSTILRESHPL